MATLNPQSLVTLWQIEQYGSFSATAKATGWSQPAISQQIKKLEAQCGSTLVQRTSHGVELTATGSMLARHGEAIADRLRRAARRFFAAEKGKERQAFDAFCATREWLEDYALFMTLDQQHGQGGKVWQDWPAPLAKRRTARYNRFLE